jgi:lincosamide nucleotidyltransferase A/C/D/E
MSKEKAAQHKDRHKSEMSSQDVLELYGALERVGIQIWIDGGWGVDALLGKRSRVHKDLDIAIQQQDLAKLRDLLEARKYQDIKLEQARPHNFVLGDAEGHEIDLHVIVLDDNGNGIYGPAENGQMYPAASLTGVGMIDNHPVRCISPEWMVKFHSGYELKEKDLKDVSAICEKFGIELPDEYKCKKPK